jgi:hypothetical protein
MMALCSSGPLGSEPVLEREDGYAQLAPRLFRGEAIPSEEVQNYHRLIVVELLLARVAHHRGHVFDHDEPVIVPER